MARLILIADDSPIIQRKAQRILQDVGFEVQTVSNGVAAVKKLPAMRPVLVLADVSMPGKDGYEVCEFVKTSAGLRHVPVLLVGSDLEPYDEQRGARVRADGIIKKPFVPHDLVAVVRRWTTPTQAPASPPTLAETPLAASSARSQEASSASHAVASQHADYGGREEEIPSADAAGPLPVADDIVTNVGQSDEHPEIEAGSLPGPSAEAGEPFPGMTLGPSYESDSKPVLDSAPGPTLAAPETSLGIEESRPEEIPISPPQIIDLTAPEDAPEINPVFVEPIPEPFSAIAPEPDLIAAETIREVEESNAQHPHELRSFHRLVDLTAPEALPEPASLIAEPNRKPAPEILPGTTGPETTREVEELNSTSQALNVSTSPKAAPEPTQIAAAPGPESVPETEPGSTLSSPEASQEWGDLISRPPALETSTAPDAEWVYIVVHKVVSRMAPPVLTPEQVVELARLLTREVMAEFGGPGGHVDFPVEGPSPG
ncbi:MAG: response regulator [Terriglobia bacterium]